MAVGQVAEFWQELHEDDDLQEELAAVSVEDLPEKFARVARKNGYEVTEDDVEALIEEGERELTEDELDQVAGGTLAPQDTMATSDGLNLLGAGLGTRVPALDGSSKSPTISTP